MILFVVNCSTSLNLYHIIPTPWLYVMKLSKDGSQRYPVFHWPINIITCVCYTRVWYQSLIKIYVFFYLTLFLLFHVRHGCLKDVEMTSFVFLLILIVANGLAYTSTLFFVIGRLSFILCASRMSQRCLKDWKTSLVFLLILIVRNCILTIKLKGFRTHLRRLKSIPCYFLIYNCAKLSNSLATDRDKSPSIVRYVFFFFGSLMVA